MRAPAAPTCAQPNASEPSRGRSSEGVNMRHDWSDNFEARNYGIAQRTDFRQFAELLKIVLMLALVAGVFVIQSWQQSRLVWIGYESQRLQGVEETLLRAEKALVLEEATLKDPARIDGLARVL